MLPIPLQCFPDESDELRGAVELQQVKKSSILPVIKPLLLCVCLCVVLDEANERDRGMSGRRKRRPPAFLEL